MATKLELNKRVKVDCYENNHPFTRIVDWGTIIGHDRYKGYLIQLDNRKENRYFRRREFRLVAGE